MPKEKLTGTQFVSVLHGGTSVWQYSQDDNKIIRRICLVPSDHEEGKIKFRNNNSINFAKHQQVGNSPSRLHI